MSRYQDPGQFPLHETNGVFAVHPDVAMFARAVLEDGGDVTRRLILADNIEDKAGDIPNAAELAPMLRQDGRWVIQFNGNDRRPFLAWQPARDIMVVIGELSAAACPACADCGSSPKFERPERHPVETNLKHVDALEWRTWRLPTSAGYAKAVMEVGPAWRCLHMCWRDARAVLDEGDELPGDIDIGPRPEELPDTDPDEDNVR